MDEREQAKRFQADLDRLLEEGQASGVEDQPAEYRQLLATASRLAAADGGADRNFRLSLQERMRSNARNKLPDHAGQNGRLPGISGALRVGAGLVLLLVFVLGLNWVFSHLKPTGMGGLPEDLHPLAPTPQATISVLQPTRIPSDLPGPLVEFPLPVGTRWIYSFQEYQPSASDPTQTITATGYITETIVNTRQAGNLFLAQVDRGRRFTGLPAGWPESPAPDSTGFWYVIMNRKVYESPILPDSLQNFTETLPLQYDFPLTLGKTWCPSQVDLKDPNRRKITDCTAAGKQTVKEQDVYATPAGKFENCVYITQDFNSGGVNQWFCNGVGMVASQYDHAGSRFGYRQVLVQYHPGTPIVPSRLPTATPVPTSQAGKTRLTIAELKNMQYCQPNYCWAEMKDGKFGNGDKTGELIEPASFGDLNGDGWEDAAVIIKEKAFETTTFHLIAVLNNNGQPGKTIQITLWSDVDQSYHISNMQIADSQIVVEVTYSTYANNPESTLKGEITAYELEGQVLNKVRENTKTQDGKFHAIALQPPSSAVIDSDSLNIHGKLSETGPGIKLGYQLYDQNGTQVYSADSSATVSASGDFSLPVDLAWVEPGKLRLEVLDMYSTPNLVVDLAIDSLNIDYQPANRQIPPALFSYFQMVDQQAGWARSAETGDLLRTMDGGLTWQKSNIPYNGPFALDILDSSTAWLLGQDQSKSQQVLYQTEDGGQTWKRLPDLPSQFGSVRFLDPQHGFFADHPGGYAMMGQTRFVLFKTQDGGKTWQKVFDNTPGGAQENQEPTRGRMVFRDTQNGWTVDSVIGKTVTNSLYLMRTRDGGRSWTDVSQSLPMPDVPHDTFLSQIDLKFFGPDQAVMPLVIIPPGGSSAVVRLYISKDGGESWSLSAPVEVKSTNPTLDILSAGTVMVWDGVSGYVTGDGGQTWTAQPVKVDFPGSLSGVQFVSPSVGFALVNDHNANAQNTDLYKTSDGGQTWQKIDVKQ